MVVSQIDFGADSSYPASIGVNDAAADCNLCGKTELRGSLFAEIPSEFAGREVFAILETS